MTIRVGMMVKGRGKISEIGNGIHPNMNAPTMTPVRFQDGTYAVLDDVGRPIEYEPAVAGDIDIDTCIRNSEQMPLISSLATGYTTICVFTPDKKLTIREGYSFGREGEFMWRWEDLVTTEPS